MFYFRLSCLLLVKKQTNKQTNIVLFFSFLHKILCSGWVKNDREGKGISKLISCQHGGTTSQLFRKLKREDHLSPRV
jgi:hypothetical protein